MKNFVIPRTMESGHWSFNADKHHRPRGTTEPNLTLSFERLREILCYDPISGIFTWKERVARCVRIGDVAGAVAKSGYRKICIKKQTFAEHRLAWLYMTGNWPENQIDHINKNKADNRFFNLREVSAKENCANRAMKAGVSGIPYVSPSQKGSRLPWVAKKKIGGKVRNLGYGETPLAAAIAGMVL